MINDTILNIDSIRKSFVRNIVNIRGKNEDEKFYVLEDIDLMIPKGKITALIGGNGTGKTTLFNIISGFIKADEGKIEFKPNGKFTNLTNLKAHNIARLGIGRMFQDNHIFQNMTVMENMLIADENFFGERPFEPIINYKKSKTEEEQRIKKAEKILTDLFGNDKPFLKMKNDKAKNLSYIQKILSYVQKKLLGLAILLMGNDNLFMKMKNDIAKNDKAKNLSFGQQRLLGLARLLMGDYKLLLLDEPTSGVNPQIIEKIKEIIKYFVEQHGLTVFIIEHNMKFVLDVADFCHFMSKGKIAVSGTPEDIIGNPEVRKTYLGI